MGADFYFYGGNAVLTKSIFYGHWSDNLFFCLCRGLPTFTHFTNFLQILAVKNPTKLPTFKQGITF